MPVTRLLVATNNTGKVRELERLFETTPVSLVSLGDFPAVTEVPETGTTFAENSRLKSLGYAAQTGVIALADDSGLEVEALGGRPGVMSARYGGDSLGFPEKMQLLLAEIENSDVNNRRARFVCAVSIADPAGIILCNAEGYCHGTIALEPRGTGGFGYDPLFIPDGYGETFGELDKAIKAEISHRSAAIRQIIPFLGHFKTV